MAEKTPLKASEEAPSASQHDVALEDSDPDIDELDDVLDQFSASTAAQKQKHPETQPIPSASGPGRPSEPTVPHSQLPNESEDEFLSRLTKEMQSVMSQMSTDPAASGATPEDIEKIGKELEDFTLKMEAEGIKPEDLLKAILGEDTGRKVSDAAKEERDRQDSEARGEPAEKSSFDETIRKTMQRMESSDSKATEATQAGGSEEEMLAELLRAMESEGGADGEGDLSKMFLGMMEQLTHKDMLYEPMKELHEKYPRWMEKNKVKLKPEDAARYAMQQVIVKEIVEKFEERSYSDQDPACREYIWERMQRMQGEGAPPDELVGAGFPGMGGGDADDVGCPTQ